MYFLYRIAVRGIVGKMAYPGYAKLYKKIEICNNKIPNFEMF